MKIATFEGGQSSRLSPNLIQPNEAVKYVNVDNTRGILEPVKGKKVVQEGRRSIYKFQGQWISHTEVRDYVEWQSKLYWTSPSGAKKYNGTDTHKLGLSAYTRPLQVEAVNGTGGDSLEDGTFQYVMTYYNENDGTESPPNEPSVEVTTVAGYVKVKLDFASSDPQTTHMRLYRVGGDKTVFSLVAELVNEAQTYEDRTTSVNIPGEVLDSQAHYPPVEGLQYLTEAYGCFFGAKGATLHVSEIGNPNYWPYQIEFPKTVTGIGAVQNGVLVFTQYETYILTGTEPSNFVKYLLSGDQGCISHKSVQFIKNTLVWLSTDGICTSTGGDLQILSKHKLGKISLTPIASAVYDEVYYLFHTEGITALDLRFQPIFKSFSDSSVQGAGVFDDILYVSDGTYIYEMFQGDTKESLEWLSPVITEGAYILHKSYSEVYAIYEGQLTLEVYITDKIVATHQLNSTGVAKAELGIPTQDNRGYSIQFRVTGTGTLYELDYKGTAYAKQ